MINTKTSFAVLIFLLSMSSLLNSCTKNTEYNTSINMDSSKPKAQLISSTDPKIPLYAVNIKICKDENYIIATGYDYDQEQGKFSPAPCYENSLPIWGSSDTDIVPESFNPDIYFYRTSVVSHLRPTDSYDIVLSSYGCYTNVQVPQETKNYYLFPRFSVDISKKITNSEKLIQLPNEMVTIRRIDDRDEIQKLLLEYHVNNRVSSFDKCQIIDSSKLSLN